MLQLRNDLCFALKASPQLDIPHQLRIQDFDGDGAVQPRIPCPVHFTHTAGAKWREDFVRAEFGTSGQHHKCVARRYSAGQGMARFTPL